MCVRAYRTRQSVLQILESLERVHVCVLDYVYLHMEYTRTYTCTYTYVYTCTTASHTNLLDAPTACAQLELFTQSQLWSLWFSCGLHLIWSLWFWCGLHLFGHFGSGAAYIWSFWFWGGLHLVTTYIVCTSERTLLDNFGRTAQL